MQIHALTSLRLIKPKMAALCKEEAIRELALLLDKAGKRSRWLLSSRMFSGARKSIPRGLAGASPSSCPVRGGERELLAVGKCRRLDWSGPGMNWWNWSCFWLFLRL